MLQIFKDCGVDVWANELKEKYFDMAMQHLNDIAVVSNRKAPLKELAEFLIVREN
jgi:geranylgeranyl diphosphate synthase type II